MYIIAHKLYQAQKRPSSLLIQCPMDHQQCLEHVVIREGATCGAGREVIWMSKPYMGPEVILRHHRDAPRTFKGEKVGICSSVVLTISCSAVWDHSLCIKSHGIPLFCHSFFSDSSSLPFITTALQHSPQAIVDCVNNKSNGSQHSITSSCTTH